MWLSDEGRLMTSEAFSSVKVYFPMVAGDNMDGCLST